MFRAILWGTGKIYNTHLNTIHYFELLNQIKIEGIVSNDIRKDIQFLDGYPVLNKDRLSDLMFDIGLMNINLESLVVTMEGNKYISIETEKHITPRVFKNLLNLIKAEPLYIKNLNDDGSDELHYVRGYDSKRIELTYKADMTKPVEGYLVDLNRFNPGIFNIDTNEAKLLYIDQKHYIRSIKRSYSVLTYTLKDIENKITKTEIYNLLYNFTVDDESSSSTTMSFFFNSIYDIIKRHIRYEDLINVHKCNLNFSINKYFKNEIFKQIYFNTFLFNKFGNVILIRIDNTKFNQNNIDEEYEDMLNKLLEEDI